MYHPTTRVLTVLELLQTHGTLTGPQIAARLEVNVRTARRYITMLQDMGIPIEAERGRAGGYGLGAGYKLPPLMFTNDEGLALAIGMLAARRLGIAEIRQAIESGAAKLARTLPAPVREQVRALDDVVVLDLPPVAPAPRSGVVLALSAAAHAGRRVHLRYQAAGAEPSEREFDPYGLVLRDGHWYAIGYCHTRRAQRLFRLDRILQADPLAYTFQRPATHDLAQEVAQQLRSVPRDHAVRVDIADTLEHLQEFIPRDSFFLEASPTGILLHGHTNSLDWLAGLLAQLHCPFEILEPAALKDAVRARAEHLLRCVGASPTP